MNEVNPHNDELTAAVGRFISAFALLESSYLTAALHAVTDDPVLVLFLSDMTDLSQRLNLFQCVAKFRVGDELQSDIAAFCDRISKLAVRRNEIVHGRPEHSSARLRMRVSKRALPTLEVAGPGDDRSDLMRARRHETTDIDQWARDAAVLRTATRELAQKVRCYRRGEPWEHLKIDIPDQVGREGNSS